MHIYFSGISGAGIGPLALIALQAGYHVSGSDKQMSDTITYLNKQGINAIHIGQTEEAIAKIHQENPIDWFVYSSAIEKENAHHPELMFTTSHGIRNSKRDVFLAELLKNTNKQLIAIAGTHGKTTTTAMMIWLFKAFEVPISYSVGGKLPFGAMGEFDEKSAYFVYEADEYDRNFLSFNPDVSIISGIDYDHPDIYPTREEYYAAFQQFLSQSESVFMHSEDAQKLAVRAGSLHTTEADYSLVGAVNRRNAQLVVEAFQSRSNIPYDRIISAMNRFPGVSRRFEEIAPNIYSDYAHTPEKIRGALQTAQEVAGSNVVVVYEGLHNTRQHFIKDDLKMLFSDSKKLYIVPSYLAREDEKLELFTPEKLCTLTEAPAEREPAQCNEHLKEAIAQHANQGDLVLCLSAGGGGSLDEWLRQQFKK
jgi:UDP-N-acetylmuramate--alanine ligase